MYISVYVYMCGECVYVRVCVCMHMCMHVCTPGEARRGFGPPGADGSCEPFKIDARSQIQVLSARTVRAFDHHAISPAPCKMFLKLIAKDLKDQLIHGSPGLSSVNC